MFLFLNAPLFVIRYLAIFYCNWQIRWKKTYWSITIALESRNPKLLLNSAGFSDLLQKTESKFKILSLQSRLTFDNVPSTYVEHLFFTNPLTFIVICNYNFPLDLNRNNNETNQGRSIDIPLPTQVKYIYLKRDIKLGCGLGFSLFELPGWKALYG